MPRPIRFTAVQPGRPTVAYRRRAVATKLDPEMEDLLARLQESERRSRERRATARTARAARGRHTALRFAALALAVLVGGLAIQAPGLAGGEGSAAPGSPAASTPRAPSPTQRAAPSGAAAHPDRRRSTKPAKVPTAAALREAWRYAQARGGLVSVAVVNSEGKLRGRDAGRRYASASVVKAMLLAAEVRRLKQADAGIDSATDSLLTAMITASDNDAADSVYARVGDAGLEKVAQRAAMRRFTVAGYWGNARITAADMARFFGDLDRVLPRRHREYAKGLLGSIIESQRWGIPDAAGEGWAVRFKGGWLPDRALVHQAAELRERDGSRELSMAILTDSQPSFEYGIETIEGVAARLLSR